MKDEIDGYDTYFIRPKQYQPQDEKYSFKSIYINNALYHSDKTNIWIHMFTLPVIFSAVLGIIGHF